MWRVEKFRHLPATVDGIPIEGMTDDILDMFLKRREPLESCKICSGARGESIPWHQNKNREEWEKEAGVAEALA